MLLALPRLLGVPPLLPGSGERSMSGQAVCVGWEQCRCCGWCGPEHTGCVLLLLRIFFRLSEVTLRPPSVVVDSSLPSSSVTLCVRFSALWFGTHTVGVAVPSWGTTLLLV